MRITLTYIFIFLTTFLSAGHIDQLVNEFMSITPASKGNYYQKDWYYNKEVYEYKLKTEHKIYREEDLLERLYWLSGYGLRGEYLDRIKENPEKGRILDPSISINSLEVSDIFNILHLITLAMRSEITNPQDLMMFYRSAEIALNRYSQEDIPNLLAGGEFIRTGDYNYSRVVYQTMKDYLERNSILPTKSSDNYGINFFMGLNNSDWEIPEENPSFLNEYNIVKAIKDDDLKRAKEVLESNPPGDNLTFYGVSLIHFAARVGSYDIAKLLLERGYSPNKLDVFGISPLWVIAPAADKFDIQNLLIEYGADINLKFQGESVIFNALKRKNFDLVNLLIDKGAYLSGFNYKRDTLMDLSFVNWDKKTSLRVMEEFSKRELIKSEGKYIMRALKELDGEAFGKVISQINNVNDEFNGETPIEVALSSSIRDKEVKVGLLLDRLPPGNFNERGHTLVLQYLLDENTRRLKAYSGDYAPHLFDILDRTNKKDLIQGNDSLLYQLSQGNSREMILKASEYYRLSDGEVLIENPFNTFRIVANLSAKGYGDIIGTLTPYLSREDFLNQDGWSILTYMTLYKGYREPIKSLIEAGFNPNLRTKKGIHLISLLAKVEDYETIIWLGKNGAQIDSPREIAAFIPPDAAISDAKKCIEELKINGAILE